MSENRTKKGWLQSMEHQTSQQYRDMRLEELRNATSYVAKKEKEREDKNIIKVFFGLLVFWGVVIFTIFQCHN
ncbi:MAG: hypothetical protein BWY21_02141 [Parcubacteria group bacterium ADurb.Bin216]|nr:MAG: hypothetical protein BWY21_02141 [Parcubacteria group bacterium ADurb.Bin216]